ncbi:MAG: hypothetical protein VX071_04560 [Candidatus Thermoplasmatota archaeon]|nr:hypothetical protein [Candidatus Thermoplasmatota archaeon]
MSHNEENVCGLQYVLDLLQYPMKHLDWSGPPDPDLEPMDQALEDQEAVDQLVEVLAGHVETLLDNPGVKEAITTAMSKGGSPDESQQINN